MSLQSVMADIDKMLGWIPSWSGGRDDTEFLRPAAPEKMRANARN